MTDSGSYTFEKPANAVNDRHIWPIETENFKLMEHELPNDLKPVDKKPAIESENELQRLLDHFMSEKSKAQHEVDKAKARLDHVNSEISFYEKAIKSYNKAFKK